MTTEETANKEYPNHPDRQNAFMHGYSVAIQSVATIKQLQEENCILREAIKEQQEAFTSMTSSATAFKFWQELKSKNEEMREENQRLKEALSLQDDYVKLLGEEIDTMIPLAHTHGWRSTRHEAGKELRAKINNARKLIEP